MGRVRSPKRRVRDDDFIVGYPRISSDYPRIVFILAEAIQGVSPEILNLKFRGRRSIWWGWRVTLVAPRIVNDVSWVKRINHESDFPWQAQYLVKLEVDCLVAPPSGNVVYVRRMQFGEVGVTSVASRIVNDVSYVRGFNHDVILRVAGAVVKLEGDSCCSAHCKWRFICEEDQSWEWSSVAGAVFGEVGRRL